MIEIAWQAAPEGYAWAQPWVTSTPVVSRALDPAGEVVDICRDRQGCYFIRTHAWRVERPPITYATISEAQYAAEAVMQGRRGRRSA